MPKRKVRAGQWMTSEEFRKLETEAQFTSWLRRTAKEFGWKFYHTRFSIMSDAGFPDCTLVKPGQPVIFAELKKHDGEPTEKQQEWLDALSEARGTKVYLWRPQDKEAIVRVLFEGFPEGA